MPHSKEWAAAYYQKNKERINAKSREWHANHPNYYKYDSRRYYLKEYGLTPEQVLDIIVVQHNKCLACGKDLDPMGNHKNPLAPVVDHCHITGKNRGVLHRKCNAAIGMLGCGDDPESLRRAADYLESYGEVRCKESSSGEGRATGEVQNG